MTDTNKSNAGEAVGMPAVGGDFAQALRVSIRGYETSIERRVREEVAPRVHEIFTEAGYKLAANPDVVEALAFENMKAEFVLPRYIPVAFDAAFMPEELVAHEQLRLMIVNIAKQENPTLDFEHDDPQGVLLRKEIEDIFILRWNDARQARSAEAQAVPGRSEYFRLDVNKNSMSMNAPQILVRYRADRISQLHPLMRNAPAVAM